MKRFVELKLSETSRKVLLPLDDITEVIEEMRCEGKVGKDSYREYKVIRVYTGNHNAYECDHSCYAMLKNYLGDWSE